MSESITEQTILQANENAISTTVDGEEVILDLDSNTYYGLNETGSLIWSALQEPVEVAELERLVVDEYDADETRLHQDMMTFLDEMLEADLVSRHENL